MGKLIIDGNSVFEIDEECLKRRKLSKDCDLKKYLNDEKKQPFVKTGTIEKQPKI